MPKNTEMTRQWQRVAAEFVAEADDEITLAKGDRVECLYQDSQRAFVACQCDAGIVRGYIPLSHLEPANSEEWAENERVGECLHVVDHFDEELELFRAQFDLGELQTTRAPDSGDEADDDFEELIKDVERARAEASDEVPITAAEGRAVAESDAIKRAECAG